MKNINLNEEKIKPRFSTPKGYFENFEDNLFRKFEVKKTQPKILSILNKKIIISSAVAALLIITLGTFSYYNMNNEVEIETIENYLALQPSINAFEISQHLSNSDITLLEENLIELNENDYYLETIDIENYLIN